MLFSEIINRLQFKETYFNRIVKDTQIYAVRALGDGELFRADTLYVADGTREWRTSASPQNVIWLGDKSSGMETYANNFVRIDADESPSELIERINDMLINSQKLQQLRIKMMDIIMHGKGLNGALDDIGQTLNVSIVVMDIGGKILSISHPFMISNPLWLESVEKGYCQPFFLEHLRDIRAASADKSGPIYRKCEENDLHYLAERIYVSNELFGYVFMLSETDAFNSFCEDVLSFVSKAAIEYVFRSRDSGGINATLYKNLFLDMLNGISSEQIEARMRAGEVKFPDRMCIAVLKPKYFHGDNYVRDILIKKLKAAFPNEIIVYRGEEAIIMFSMRIGQAGLSDESRKTMEHICAQEILTAGLSNPYNKIALTKYYFDQADSALKLARKLDIEGYIFEYKNLSVFDVIDRLPSDTKLALFCHPALSILREYDAQNGTQLYDTLQAFADNGFNQNLTASSLYLHRNTLTYRKQKIISLTDIDFEDIKTQYLLRFSFLVEKYIQKTRL